MDSSSPSRLPVFLIGIDGHGGSGKSTLAEALAQQFDAQIIHTDDFASWENPVDWWPSVIERVFEPLARGAAILEYPRTQWWESQTPSPQVRQPVTDVMILEGVTALRSEFRPWIAFGIFVDTSADICLQRGFARDQGMDGKSDAEILAMWHTWIAAEEQYIARDSPRAFAKWVIDGSKSLKVQLPLLVAAIQAARMTCDENNRGAAS